MDGNEKNNEKRDKGLIVELRKLRREQENALLQRAGLGKPFDLGPEILAFSGEELEELTKKIEAYMRLGEKIDGLALQIMELRDLRT